MSAAMEFEAALGPVSNGVCGEWGLVRDICSDHSASRYNDIQHVPEPHLESLPLLRPPPPCPAPPLPRSSVAPCGSNVHGAVKARCFRGFSRPASGVRTVN